jgi:membrane protein implicated in regulation of membrane protease activity
MMAVAAFFVALPIFLAALAVFTGTALYMGWRFRKALKEAQKQMEKMQDYKQMSSASEIIIDITNDK